MKKSKTTETKTTETKTWTILVVLFCAILGAVGQLLIKLGADRLNSITDVFFNWYIIFGLVVYLFGTVFFVIALKYGEITTLYPLIATSYVWVSFLSIVYLNEIMTHTRWVGIVFIIFGVSIIGYSAKRSNKEKRREK